MASLISILIPAYNKEQWIHETLLSAINQTWPNKEIIVVDDGSTDNTYRIAKSLESRTVKVVTQPNAGACGARNNAFKLAQGDYIQWLDADDILDHDKIAMQLHRGDEGGDSRTLLTGAWATFYYRYKSAAFVEDSLWRDRDPVDWIVTKFVDNVWMNPTVWLVSRRLTELAGPWDERLNLSGDDDGEYVCRVAAASQAVKFAPGARCYYRVGNVGSLNWDMGKSDERLKSLLLSLRLSIQHLRGLEESERTRRASVAHLQTWLPLFYPEKHELLLEIGGLVSELGGKLNPPQASWKQSLIERMVGSATGKHVMGNLRRMKQRALSRYDKVLYDLLGNG